jgi:PIN domain nuclease of toxin-antitoxin system
MKTLVVDTHALVWHLTWPKRLGKAARRQLLAVDKGVAKALIPAIVLVELTLLREAGRRVIGPLEVEAAIRMNPNISVYPMDLAQSKEFVLAGSIEDPFDRLVIAAARAADAPLLTADATIQASGLAAVIWD